MSPEGLFSATHRDNNASADDVESHDNNTRSAAARAAEGLTRHDTLRTGIDSCDDGSRFAVRTSAENLTHLSTLASFSLARIDDTWNIRSDPFIPLFSNGHDTILQLCLTRSPRLHHIDPIGMRLRQSSLVWGLQYSDDDQAHIARDEKRMPGKLPTRVMYLGMLLHVPKHIVEAFYERELDIYEVWDETNRSPWELYVDLADPNFPVWAFKHAPAATDLSEGPVPGAPGPVDDQTVLKVRDELSLHKTELAGGKEDEERSDGDDGSAQDSDIWDQEPASSATDEEEVTSPAKVPPSAPTASAAVAGFFAHVTEQPLRRRSTVAPDTALFLPSIHELAKLVTSGVSNQREYCRAAPGPPCEPTHLSQAAALLELVSTTFLRTLGHTEPMLVVVDQTRVCNELGIPP